MHTNNRVLEALTPEHFRRFWSKVDKGPECWTWRGAVHPNGYGSWTVTYDGRRQTSVRPHRVAWFDIRGPIPDGLVLDHLCRNQVCVNPDHLEIVSQSVNISRVPAVREDATEALTRALISRHSPESFVAWWEKWLASDRGARQRMERGALAMTEGLFAEDAA